MVLMAQEQPTLPKLILVCGFSKVGKTTVARKLALRLNSVHLEFSSLIRDAELTPATATENIEFWDKFVSGIHSIGKYQPLIIISGVREVAVIHRLKKQCEVSVIWVTRHNAQTCLYDFILGCSEIKSLSNYEIVNQGNMEWLNVTLRKLTERIKTEVISIGNTNAN